MEEQRNPFERFRGEEIFASVNLITIPRGLREVGKHYGIVEECTSSYLDTEGRLFSLRW